MSSASYLLAINISVASLLAAAFWIVSAWSDRPKSARLLAASYVCGVFYYAAEFITPHLTDARFGVTAGFLAILAATTIFSASLAVEFGRRMSWLPLSLVAAISPAVVFLAQDLPRQSYVRLFAYQTPLAIVLALCIVAIWSAARRRGRMETALLVVLTATSIHFLVKPFLSRAMSGSGANAENYIQSAYALASQSIGTVLAFANALLCLAILVRGILASAAAKSETDNLSALYNRRGFERAAEQALEDADRRRRPIALVMADIDRFKAINDRFGHAAGDEAIRLFAELLRAAAPGHPVGRTGGEEFAVIIVGAESIAGKLFAEGVRTALANTTIYALGDEKVTASFGVAERAPGETLAHLTRRADMALYEAKNSGRNCVRLSPYVAGLVRGDRADASGRGLGSPVASRYPASSSGDK